MGLGEWKGELTAQPVLVSMQAAGEAEIVENTGNSRIAGAINMRLSVCNTSLPFVRHGATRINKCHFIQS